MKRFRTGTVATCAALLPLVLLTAACTNTGGLDAAGPTPTASGPVHLWPGRQGATVPPADPGGAPPEYVKGIPPVRDEDVHAVDPVALVQAEVKNHPKADVGPDGMPKETADAIRGCRPGERTPQCPVLSPYYRDLTGNGKDELIIGIELPDRMLSVRVYTADPDGRLNRIMATTETAVSVELAGRDVIVRVPSGNPGYELITAWSWDEKQRTMLPTREQIVRVPQQNPGTGPGGGTGPGNGSGNGNGNGPGNGTGPGPGVRPAPPSGPR
ncbi:hypothetical protein [Streptomyces sp. WAC06614]|uniref:hypothetical protein n=1 Tax=Streptomyces sp. WAC06614 TaxID=2487416 RepID=UPI00163BE314|nr:hypothetical protein [Streptomyces sp. WAC06614]